MLDDVARFNRERWEDLAKARVKFSRPWLDLDPATARARVDPEGMLAEVAGADVLCLAAGGGQQSSAFAMLGTRVTVLDFSATQIERDRVTAAHHGVSVTAIEGDMRDLARFPDRAFDIVWQAHALNFVPDPAPVLDGVARLLRPGGLYRLQWTNPFLHGLWDDTWTGTGYELRRRSEDGGEIAFDDPEWDVRR
ncbi:MAG TPA: class I SAM-dependent methyltransferase, partial [Candidatus Limnocylindrales bacterium]|nr:class I SAM-dependent methyltransferase [Candidatus Limnocylindrales bacterium]